MKTLLRTMLPGLLLMTFMGGSAWAQGRIATLDLIKVFDQYYKTKQARTGIEDLKTAKEKEHAGLAKDCDKMRDEYQALLAAANNQAFSSEEREKNKKLAEDKSKQVRDAEEDLVRFASAARSTVADQWERFQVKAIEEIRVVVQAKAKAAGYNLVLDVAGETARGTPIVLYSSGESDITQAVLEQLNATAPPEPSAGKAKEPEKKMR